MSFRASFPTVARLLASTGLVGNDDQRQDPPADDEENGEDDDANGNGDDDQNGSGDDNSGGGGNGGGQARNRGPSPAAVQEAFQKDAAALVGKERERCVKVFTSDAGRRSPIAAGKMLERAPDMSADDVIDTLNDVGSSASDSTDRRQAHRDRLNASKDAKPETGAGDEDTGGREGAVERHKKRREQRNEQAKKQGAVPVDKRD